MLQAEDSSDSSEANTPYLNPNAHSTPPRTFGEDASPQSYPTVQAITDEMSGLVVNGCHVTHTHPQQGNNLIVF